MYDHFLNPDIFTISSAIYMLGLLSLVLGIKVFILERKNRKQMDYILYMHDRVSKLEEENKQ